MTELRCEEEFEKLLQNASLNSETETKLSLHLIAQFTSSRDFHDFKLASLFEVVGLWCMTHRVSIYARIERVWKRLLSAIPVNCEA